MKILSVVGARPNFMKIAPLYLAIDKYMKDPSPPVSIRHILVHTGQHYDKQLSDIFLKDLCLPKPDYDLGVGSASHAVQTAEIMKRFEGVLLAEKPDFVLLVGDVNSTLACSLVATKIQYNSHGSRPLIAHIEAGLRSCDRSMPEETNRIVTDHVSDLLFVTEESAIANLTKEGLAGDKIHFVGNTMIDSLLLFKKAAGKSPILDRLGLSRTAKNAVSGITATIPYALCTLHRPANVDDDDAFTNILKALADISTSIPILFPCHPRTKNRIADLNLDGFFNHVSPIDMSDSQISHHPAKNTRIKESINLIEPLGYLDFLQIMSHSKIVFTDSGGIQEETTCLGIPCVTLRENTERPVTITHGTNVLAGMNRKGIQKAYVSQMRKKFKPSAPQYWDGKASERILQILINTYTSRHENT